MIKTVLFDLDGTLLPMDIDEFVQKYFKALTVKFANLGYDQELILKGVFAGIKAMYKNDGTNTNEIVFWQSFELAANIERSECESQMLDFYQNEFVEIGKALVQNEKMIKAVKLLVKKGYRLLLTTNPLFPASAVDQRINWAGIDPAIFALKTSYETCHYTKPNLKYYQEIIAQENLNLDECLMVGNDVIEDGVIETLGIPLYLVTDCLINRDNQPIKSKYHGNSQEFYDFVVKLPDLNN